MWPTDKLYRAIQSQEMPVFFCSAGFVDLTAASKGEYAFCMPRHEGGTIFGRAVVNFLSENSNNRLKWQHFRDDVTRASQATFGRTVGEYRHMNGFIQKTQTVFEFGLDVKQVGQPAMIKQPDF
jgi:hypothetical protein